MAIKALTGSKSGDSGGAPNNTPDSYFSDDLIEVILGISEGKIKGLKDGSSQHFRVGDTPLTSETGAPNFDSLSLVVNKGSEFGEVIVPRLGGTASSVTVNTELAQHTPVIREGTLTDIDWLEIRLVINALSNQTDGSLNAWDLDLDVHYKTVSEAEWRPGVIYQDTEAVFEEDTQSQRIDQVRSLDNSATTAARRQTCFTQPLEPTLTEAMRSSGQFRGYRVLWFDLATSLVPKFYSDGTWYTPDGVVVDYTQKKESVSFVDVNYFRTIDPGRQNHTRTIFLHTEGNPTAPKLGDLWVRDHGGSPTLWYNGSAWVGLLAPDVEYDPLAGNEIISQDGRVHFHDKISAPAVREIKIKVARTGEPYQIRVIKRSQDSSHETITSAVSWESFQEIKSEPLIFPNLATAHLSGRASDQFSSIPDFWGVYEGRIIRVPSNYDPVSRTYAGVWDGTWKLDYSNNPAFVAYDLVMNDRYGLNSAYPVELDPFDVYEAGAWCDIRVGEKNRPQFTFNGLISEPRSAREAITYICGIFGGRFLDDGNGYARIKLDKDDPAVHLFTKENVEGGLFKYSYSEIETRKNDYTVAFVNPELGWKEDRRRVYDQERIDTYGRVPEDFIAFGCTSADEAIARGRQKLITDQTETETISFTTQRAGLYLEPYDIFLVSDDSMDEVITGRVAAVGERTIDLRDPIYLEAGFEHKLVITGFKNGDYEVHTYVIEAGSTGQITDTLTVTTDLATADIPDEAVFSIDSGLSAKPYRLIHIDETSGDPDKVTITGLEVNRTKWAEIHQDTGSVDVDIPQFETALTPVTNLRVVPSVEQRLGRAVQILRVFWDAHPNKFVRRYELYYRFNDDGWMFAGELQNPSFELSDVLSGRYVFRVRAVSFTGEKSVESFVDIDLVGDVRIVAPVKNLRVTNATEVANDIHHFDDASAEIAWDVGALDPALHNYWITFYNDVDQPVRTETTGATTFSYSLQKIHQDQITRNFSIGVTVWDVHGNSSEETLIHAYNPAPPVLSPSVKNGVRQASIYWDTAGIEDYVGTLVWVSENAGFDPEARPADYDLVANQLTVPIPDDDPRFVRIAAYDLFGRVGLNYSSEIRFDPIRLVDVDAPGRPTGFAVESAVISDGSVKVVYTWNANPEEDLAGYYLEIRDSPTGGFVQFQTNDTRYEITVQPGTPLDALLSAFDVSFNQSLKTDLLSHVAAKDNIPPATPTGLRLRVSFDAAWLTWAKNTEVDLNYYEVYSGSDGVAPTAETLGQYTLAANSLAMPDLEGGETLHLWVRAVDTSGNASPWSTPVSGTTLSVEEITAEIMRPVPVVVDVLPDPITETTPKRVYLSTDLKIYEQLNGEWVDEKSARLITGEIVENQIKDLAISAEKLKAGAVQREKLARNAVNGSKLALFSVDKARVRSNAIDTKKLREFAVVPEKIADGAVVTEKIASRAIIADKIDIGAVVADAIAANAVVAGKIAANAVTANEIEAGAVVTDKLDALAVTTDKLAVGAVEAEKIAANAVSAVHIAAETITAAEISSEAITTDKLDAEAVTAQKIKGGSIEAVHMTAGSVATDHLQAGAVTAQKVTTGELITLSAQIKDAIINSAKIIDLDAAKLKAGSILSGTIKVGSEALSSIQSKAATGAQDPATRINAASTTIDPGKILISGSTRLSDWQMGGDTTKINGGAVSANTVDLNKLTVGARGIKIEYGLEFEHNSPGANQVSWSSGIIVYVDHNGATVRQFIPSGSLTYTSGTLYIVWQYGDTSLDATTNSAIIAASDHVLLATYRGGAELVTDSARTIIEGSKIKTGTVDSDQIKSRAILAEHIEVGQIFAEHIDAYTITGDKIAGDQITGGHIKADAIDTEHLTLGGVITDKLAIGASSVTNAYTNTVVIPVGANFGSFIGVSIAMSHPGALFITFTAVVGYASGEAGLYMRLLLNGLEVWNGGGEKGYNVMPSGSIICNVGAGTHDVILQVRRGSSGNPAEVQRSTLSIIGAKR